ncbi:cytosol aminopeptidase [Bacterioplanes sanyensis]|uniref:leucyl aminopeptidase family protein n=1 Tax=Bacterioplanes sanyensis TaxID=1249553 RepID=UPI00167B0686|nr:leucyl aminopeptidase family protein [Bacterioplanes sanyensis]GGY52481.1 cytosol aminopeptidase [Bacterioplanes sanyensis]
MSTVIVHQQGGTPLSIFEPQQYENWLEQQSQATRQWLKTTGFSGKGVALLPAENGELSQAIAVVSDLQDMFACGDLSSQLPEGEYCIDNVSDPDRMVAIAFAWGSGAYRYERYRKNDDKLARLNIADEGIVREANDLIEATALTRDLINTPASDMMPQDLATVTQHLAERYNAVFRQWVGEDLKKENYPMIHAVGRASVHEPRLLQLTWGNPEHPKVTLVGKGVCFDSGGLNLKPGNAMRLMKKDMGGAAQVLGLAQLIMARHLPVRLRVLVPAVENAVSGDAFRPGDVINTRQGLSVEIDNTDAEGRLVLCDALTEAAGENPDLIVDFATLTGACRVALGTELPGFFTNQLSLVGDLMQSGERVSDPVWSLPLHQPYNDFLKSDVADLVNCASTPFGGAITAALYLQNFVADVPWVHFDVMAWNNRKLAGRPVGGEAMGIRAVFEYLHNRFQD